MEDASMSIGIDNKKPQKTTHDAEITFPTKNRNKMEATEVYLKHLLTI